MSTHFFCPCWNPSYFPYCLKEKPGFGGEKKTMGTHVKCFLSNVAPAFQKKKNQWRAVFYEIQLLTYNGSAHQHSPGAHILLHFPSFNR